MKFYIGFGACIIAIIFIMVLLMGVTRIEADTKWAESNIRIYHDDQRQVTCWIYFSSGISCLPDD